MKKVIFALMLPLIVVSGLVFANRKIKTETETQKEQPQKQMSSAERNAEMKKWEATPSGKKFKEWEESPRGKKVYAAEAKIWKHITNYTNMEGMVTSLSLPPGSKLGFGVMVKINDDDYIVTFDAEKYQLEQLRSLKVNDKIILKSRYVAHAPKYSYPIISCGSLERDRKVIFKRIPNKGGC
ncbi:hypothetical protein NZ698_13325 [Chryseobacterium sp. PBS4-4]|uniref:Uncharacterized protein n=1 Tax=Chryseobacterium edaphi TaxID=2976532 RepID=A0ABT2W9T9_9FLAO|nr:hypothetical protein [Chryseobacterium edaphi]MCU7618184.1 hypothetical protein [Chryseobacterium edaphi]